MCDFMTCFGVEDYIFLEITNILSFGDLFWKCLLNTGNVKHWFGDLFLLEM